STRSEDGKRATTRERRARPRRQSDSGAAAFTKDSPGKRERPTAIEGVAAWVLLFGSGALLFMRSALLKSLAILALAWTSSNASAVTLDWDTVSWTPGSLTNSYDIDPSAAGNDVTLTVSGDTGQLGTEQVFPFPQTPALTTNLQGGLVTAKNSLTLMLDLANQTQNV